MSSLFRPVTLALAGILLADLAHARVCGPLPDSMLAARLANAGPPEALRIESVARPGFSETDLLVRVSHAGVNPVDWKLQAAGSLPFPATPGGDFAGEVVALGADAGGFDCGDLVAGIVDQRSRSGSYAEYVAVPARDVVRQPRRFSGAQSAAYPTVTVAAWRFLIEAAQLAPGERVLVHGGAGGVGSMLVQLAKARGAYVVATASSRNHDYLLGLGADQTIDYRSTRFEDVVAPVDVVVDTVGGDTLARSPAVLRDGGRLVTLVGRVPDALCDGARFTCPTTPPWDVARGLAYAAPLIESGALTVHVQRRYPLAEAAAAQRSNMEGHTRGKIVIEIKPAPTPSARTPGSGA
jgi:NADPH:quinone reductase-like Zn-dependent oxidoreductase